MPPQSTGERFTYVARRVFTSPISFGIWGVGAVAAYVLNTGPMAGNGMAFLLPFGAVAVAQCALLFSRLHNEEYLKRLFRAQKERDESLTDQQVEAILETMDFETRQRIRYVLQLEREITRDARADDVPSYAQHDLERIADALPALLQRAVKVATRKQHIARYMLHEDERTLQNYCTNLRKRIEAATDPVTRAQYEQALRAREAALATYLSIMQATARIDSQLENVEATLASWKAKVIRIKTADITSASSVSEGLYAEIEGLTNEIDTLDMSVTEALASEEPAPLGTRT